jgi:hypothetical protein
MWNKRSYTEPLRFLAILILLPWLVLSCGEGWDGYKEAYNVDQGEAPGEPWEGDETGFVKLGATEIETPLEGIITSDLDGIGTVRLSDLIEASQITANPESFRYDFTATDGYNLLAKRDGDLALLPNWENMQNGFLYSIPPNDLETTWQNHPWGSAISAYNVKYMNGGLIELLTP